MWHQMFFWLELYANRLPFCSVHVAIGVLMARVTSSCHGMDSGMTSCLFLTSSLDKGLWPGCRFGIPHNLAAVRYTGSPSPENIPTPACQSVTFNTLLLEIAL